MSAMKFLFAAALVACCLAAVSAKANCTAQTSCKACVKSFDCYWCEDYAKQGNRSLCSFRTTFQIKTDCPGKFNIYPTCSLSGTTLMILVAVGLGLFLVIIGILIYCCCCRSGSSARFRRDEERDTRVRTERTRRQEERRTERQTRIDDIRKKYGLGTEERYQKM